MSQHKDFNSAFKSMFSKLNKAKSKLPTVIANTGTNTFTGYFKSSSFEGKNWKVPNRRIAGTPEYKYPKKRDLNRRTRPTLIKSGALRREVNKSVREKSMKRVVWAVGLPYAQVHNEGSKVMPQRRFMGGSPRLYKMFRRDIINVMMRELK